MQSPSRGPLALSCSPLLFLVVFALPFIFSFDRSKPFAFSFAPLRLSDPPQRCENAWPLVGEVVDNAREANVVFSAHDDWAAIMAIAQILMCVGLTWALLKTKRDRASWKLTRQAFDWGLLVGLAFAIVQWLVWTAWVPEHIGLLLRANQELVGAGERPFLGPVFLMDALSVPLVFLVTTASARLSAWGPSANDEPDSLVQRVLLARGLVTCTIAVYLIMLFQQEALFGYAASVLDANPDPLAPPVASLIVREHTVQWAGLMLALFLPMALIQWAQVRHVEELGHPKRNDSEVGASESKSPFDALLLRNPGPLASVFLPALVAQVKQML